MSSRELVTRIRECCTAEVLGDAADRWAYGGDNSRLHRIPEAVVLVETHQQVVAVLALCNELRIPVTARGRGTGTTGAAVPVSGGIVISFERMSRILETDAANRFMRVQAGVLNGQVQDLAAPHGFFWAPDPGSADYCTVGGNLACCAAGPRAVKYGTTRENVLGLRVVTGDGKSLDTGVVTSKGVTGFDLTRLLVGSEGMLGLITEAVIKLTPLPESRKSMLAAYDCVAHAADAVTAIMASSVTPSKLEFLDPACVALVYPEIEGCSLLLIEVDGAVAETDSSISILEKVTRSAGLRKTEIARNAEGEGRIWGLRKLLSPGLRTLAAGKINEDVVVPVTRIAALLERIQSLESSHGLRIVCFGHAGNGNLHVNILFDPQNSQESTAAKLCLSALFDHVISLGGTLSGEHGIGLAKRDYLDREISEDAIRIMRGIKKVFDPLSILNRDKVFPTSRAPVPETFQAVK